MTLRRRAWGELLVVAALFGGALLIRTWQLDAYPPGLYLDEAAYGLDGLAARDGAFALFYPRNNGREPLFIWLLGLVFRVAGATPLTLRLTAALCGAATVVTAYWMVRELVRFAPDELPLRPGWLAGWVALFITFSYWHISLSRLGFRAITLPLLLTLAFALLWRWWARLRWMGGSAAPTLPWAWAVAGGIILGLSLYTYTAARMIFALYGGLVFALWLAAPHYRIDRRALLGAAGVTVASALLVAAPLILYFVRHPQAFGTHAAYVSIFNERFSGGNPLAALGSSASRTLLMLIGLASDPNLRHNPGQRPAVELILGLWLIAGVSLSIIYWRRLTWIFGFLWFGIFLAPVVLSAEGVPHSLRSIGLIPVVYLLIVLAMGWVGCWMQRYWHAPWARRLPQWLPLPFLVVAAVGALTGYFGAWQSVDRFRGPFFADFVELARALDSDEASRSLWLLPLPPGEDLTEDKLTTVDFVLDNPDHLVPVRLDETSLPMRLEELLQGRSTVNVLTTYGVPILTDYDTRFMDLKGYLDLVLRRNLAGPRDLAVTEGEVAGIPFVSYQLAEERDFRLPGDELPVDVAFAERVRLTALNAGNLHSAPAEADPTFVVSDQILRVPADQPVWVVLRWEALALLDSGLKTSLTLRSRETGDPGQWVGQQDRPLMSDRFPREPSWSAGDTASSFLLLYPVVGAPPGRYLLELTLYDEETGTIFPGRTPDGQPQTRVPLLEVELLPPLLAAADTGPQVALSDPLLEPGLQLAGVDLPVGPLAPGDYLRVTLHIRMTEVVSEATDVRLEMRTAGGDVVAVQDRLPGGPTYPPPLWRSGETLRLWYVLPLDAALSAGAYTLHARALVEENRGAPWADLGIVEVQGRPRLFEAPTVALPLDVRYGESVRLLGIETLESLDVVAGQLLTLPLVWQPLQRDERSLVRFAQLLDASGRVVAQQDSVACGGECPSSSWLEGEVLQESVVLAPEQPAGDYSLLLGWYDGATQQRLAAADAEGARLTDDVARVPVRILAP